MKNKDYYKLENLRFRIIERKRDEVLQVLNGNELVFEDASHFPNEQIRKLIFFNTYTEWLNSEYSILDEKEKEYLSAVIKPFRNKVSYIKKCEVHNQEYLTIKTGYSKVFSDGADLPNFEKNTMYRGMEPEREYTLEELGL